LDVDPAARPAAHAPQPSARTLTWGSDGGPVVPGDVAPLIGLLQHFVSGATSKVSRQVLPLARRPRKDARVGSATSAHLCFDQPLGMTPPTPCYAAVSTDCSAHWAKRLPPSQKAGITAGAALAAFARLLRPPGSRSTEASAASQRATCMLAIGRVPDYRNTLAAAPVPHGAARYIGSWNASVCNCTVAASEGGSEWIKRRRA
jgi:hypothetical protein